MTSRLFTLIFFILPWLAQAQHTLKVKVNDSSSGEPLPGANVTINNSTTGSFTNKEGLAELKNLPAGNLQLKISFISYHDSLINVSIPYPQEILTIGLHAEEEELEEIIVSTTRTNSRIEDLPLKVEVLGSAEMNEESALVPGNVASILGDIAVITIQRTNPINGNDAIRMQGLDPQYTLVARDGLPLYGGFSGSLGVLSIPPLDLKQVEIVKGSVSTLYGGGAIAGMINIISKEPKKEPVRTLLFNASTLKEKNLNTFFSGKLSNKVGYTLFAGANMKEAFDVNKDGFSEVPQHYNYTVHPRLFFEVSDNTKLNVGITSTIDRRRTGDMAAVNGSVDVQHPYLRIENSLRNGLDLQYTHNFSADHVLSVKSAVSDFSRELSVPIRFVPNYHFKASQYSTYSELSDRVQLSKNTLVTGVNLISESLRKDAADSVAFSNYNYVTLGVFAQNDWKVTDRFTIEAGLRYDHHNINGHFILPRAALFFKATEKLSIRLASGAGYKAPNVLALTDPYSTVVNNGASLKSERSTGVNTDINYNAVWGEVEVSLNQAFYWAEIKNPIRIITDTLRKVTYMETQSFTEKTYGTDTYAQLTYKAFELYLGFNHTEAYQKYPTVNNPMPFNPKNKLSFTVAYEPEGNWRTGIEASYMANQYYYNSLYYYNSQQMYPSTRVPNYWFWAAMIERKFGFGSIIMNAENIFDARQAKYQDLFQGSLQKPTLAPVWGPLDGRVINLSVKVKL